MESSKEKYSKPSSFKLLIDPSIQDLTKSIMGTVAVEIDSQGETLLHGVGNSLKLRARDGEIYPYGLCTKEQGLDTLFSPGSHCK